MAKKLNASNFERLPGRERYYVDKRNGEIITRRRRDTLVSGTKSIYERKAKERFASGIGNKQARYSALLRSRRDLLERESGRRVTLGEVRSSPEMKKIIKDLRVKDNSADGVKSRALQELGLRDKTWNFAVGDTPITKTPKQMRSARSKRETRTGRK